VKKVAILIPTKNRIEFAIRAIEYYASINSPHPIFIGDASKESSEELVLKTAKNNVEVYYFHWENLYDRPTAVKLAQEAKKTKITHYCACIGDDDFYIPRSLSLCADFLSGNPLYTTSQGRAFTIRLDQDGPYGDVADLCIYWDKKELNGDTALERLEEMSTSYWVPNFSVHRITEFIDDYSVGINSVTDMRLGEYANVLSTAMNGKSKFIDCLYLARGIHKNQYGRLKQIKAHGSRFEWITGVKWHTSYKELVNSLSSVLSAKDNLSFDVASEEIRFAIERLLNLDQNPSFRFLLKLKYENLLTNKIWIFFLSKLYRKIKFFHFFTQKNFSQKSLLSSKSIYFKDVSSIINSCKK
jgi:glycosyltransferase domain-containing protein